jgi:hypothetical protein
MKKGKGLIMPHVSHLPEKKNFTRMALICNPLHLITRTWVTFSFKEVSKLIFWYLVLYDEREVRGRVLRWSWTRQLRVSATKTIYYYES